MHQCRLAAGPRHGRPPGVVLRSASGLRSAHGCLYKAPCKRLVPSANAAELQAELAAHGGINSPCVTVSTDMTGCRGVYATAPLEPGAPAISVPYDSVLWAPDIYDPANRMVKQQDKFLRNWQRRHGNLPPGLLEYLKGPACPDDKLAVWLLWLRRHAPKDGMWRTYVSMLPERCDMTDYESLSNREIKKLQFDFYLGEINWYFRTCRSHSHKNFLEQLGQNVLEPMPNISDTLWAQSIVTSRGFVSCLGSTYSHADAGELLAPLADMIDHSFSPNCCWRSTDNGTFDIVTLKHISAGTQLTVNYGPWKTNDHLMETYGFTVPGNPYDIVKGLAEPRDCPSLYGALDWQLALRVAGFTDERWEHSSTASGMAASGTHSWLKGWKEELNRSIYFVDRNRELARTQAKHLLPTPQLLTEAENAIVQSDSSFSAAEVEEAVKAHISRRRSALFSLPLATPDSDGRNSGFDNDLQSWVASLVIEGCKGKLGPHRPTPERDVHLLQRLKHADPASRPHRRAAVINARQEYRLLVIDCINICKGLSSLLA